MVESVPRAHAPRKCEFAASKAHPVPEGGRVGGTGYGIGTGCPGKRVMGNTRKLNYTVQN